MRMYVLCGELNDRIIIKATLIFKKNIKKIYSKEGIYYLNNNTLHKLVNVADDLPIEEVTVNNIYKLIIDKNNLEYELEFFQLPPEHIIETIIQYTYALPDTDNIQFIIEKNCTESRDEAYFTSNNSYVNNSYDNVITYIKHTFL